MLQCIYLEARGDYDKLAEYQKTAIEKDEHADTLFKRQVTFSTQHAVFAHSLAPCDRTTGQYVDICLVCHVPFVS